MLYDPYGAFSGQGVQPAPGIQGLQQFSKALQGMNTSFDKARAAQAAQRPAAAPAVPSDGAMQPTIGPGMPVPGGAAAAAPQGGILGMIMQKLRGGMPTGLPQPGVGPAGLGAAGMLSGLPGTPGAAAAGPVAPPAPPAAGLPMDINPMNQF